MTGIPDPVDIFEIFFNFLKNNILVIKKEKKLKKCVFCLIFGSKKLRGLFDHFLPELCGRKNELFDKKIFLPNLF